MAWVWERIRTSLKQLNSDHLERRRRREETEVEVAQEAEQPAPVSLLAGRSVTCRSCHITIHHHTIRRRPDSLNLWSSCPFCGEYLLESENLLESESTEEDDSTDTGASACAGHQTFEDGLRLPPIEGSPAHPFSYQDASSSASEHHQRHIAFIGSQITSFLLRHSGFESPLPPIKNCQPQNEEAAVLALESPSGISPGLEDKLHKIGKRRSVESKEVGEEMKITPRYPKRRKSRQDFLQEVRSAEESKNYSTLQRFYMRSFDSFSELCALFKTDPNQSGARSDDPDLNMDLLYTVHDALKIMPGVIKKTVLKSIINSLLQKNKLIHHKDQVRSLFILIQSPVFASQSTYTIFGHLMSHLVSLSTKDHQLLVNWFKLLERDKFREMIDNILQFISVQQFPTLELANSKTHWWMATATKTLALLNAANNSMAPPLVEYTEFYNSALDHIDLMQEYFNWQNPHNSDSFSFCQYPFILSIIAKRYILTKDSEQQMILTARKSLVDKMMIRNQIPQIDLFFLNINVRRSNLVPDSLSEIAYKQRDLKKKLKVYFVGEPGLDMGGLTKEWFLLLIREIFDPHYGMFVYHPHSRRYWFSYEQDQVNLREYNLIGVLMGLAVYNSIILDLHFPSICYRKLLSPPVVPPANAVDKVGIVEAPSIEDLAEIVPDVAKGLQALMSYEGNVEEDMGLTFQVSLEEYGKMKTFTLKKNGQHINVTNDNRQEYVDLYLSWLLNKSIYSRFKAFYLGFHSVCASNALIMLRPEEVEMLVCGTNNLDFQELRKVTEYDGYAPDELYIEYFWNIVNSFSEDLKKKFLLFTTGSDRVTVGGMGQMTFKITRISNRSNLPMAHTCFNQLVLPEYESKEKLKHKLYIAIANAEGFGIE